MDFAFADEIIRVRTVLFVPADSETTDLADLENHRVGVVAASYDQEFIEDHFPQIEVTAFRDSNAMVEAAIDGDIDAFVSDHPTGYYRLLLADALGSFRYGTTLYTESIRPAAGLGASELVDLVNAGFANLTEKDKRRVVERWLLPEAAQPTWMMPLVVGLLVATVVLGTLTHYLSLRRLVRSRTLELRQVIARLAEEKSRAEQLANNDPLTGVANRRAFYERAFAEIERAQRYGRPLCAIVFDLDEFKQINDRFGHPGGDETIRRAAEVIETNLRDADYLARVGGDEFAALLPETSREQATALAWRMLDHLRNQDLEIDGQRVDITFSAGVASYQAGDSVDEWLKRADENLYHSKTHGRSQVFGS
jgi:diguanylate cyclase (GGDEF)-like protein